MLEDQITDISKEELVGMIHKFMNDPCVQFIKERNNTMSLMEIYGVNRIENNHSEFLAWLFDSSSDHKLGVQPVDKLIKLLVNKKTDSNTSIEVLKNDISNDELLAFLVGSNEIIKSESKREECVEGGRVDIILELDVKNIPCKIRVVFENKIVAPETNGNQTEQYYKHYSNLNDGYKNIYVFNRCNDLKPKCDKFICITYQDIVDYIIEPLLQTTNISERIKFRLEDYILSLEKSVSNEKPVDKIIMAIGEETKKLINEFWKNNSELISKIIKVLKLSDPSNDTLGELAVAVENARDYSKYSVNGEGQYGKGRMVEAVVNKYVELNPKTTVEELKNIFPDNLQGTVLIEDSAENIKDMKRFYELTLPNGTKVYISNQWGIGNVPNFIEHVNSNIEGIEIVKVV